MAWRVNMIHCKPKFVLTGVKSWCIDEGCVLFYDDHDTKGNLLCMIPLSNINSIIWED